MQGEDKEYQVKKKKPKMYLTRLLPQNVPMIFSFHILLSKDEVPILSTGICDEAALKNTGVPTQNISKGPHNRFISP